MKTLAKWSIEEYHRMIQTGLLENRSCELREGEIIEVAPEGPLHYTLGDWGASYLSDLLKGRAYVRHVGPITLPRTERSPDIAVVRLPKTQYRERHPSADDIYWLVEIADSTFDTDISEKKQIYARAGIREYWVVNVQGKQLRVFRHPQRGDYLSEEAYSQGTISPLAFPDLEISIKRLIQG